jgi:hypothetical protein
LSVGFDVIEVIQAAQGIVIRIARFTFKAISFSVTFSADARRCSIEALVSSSDSMRAVFAVHGFFGGADFIQKLLSHLRWQHHPSSCASIYSRLL